MPGWPHAREEANAHGLGRGPSEHGAPPIPAALSARGIEFSYGQLQVLFGVDIDVHAGQIVGLLGTNGAGKSTLLRVLGGLDRASAGAVALGDIDVTREPAESLVRRGVVLMQGGRSVFRSLTVEENLVAGAYTFIFDRDRVGTRVDEALEMFPALRPKLRQVAGTLSGGEQQMLGLAKAFLLDPVVLMIDELSLGLAPVAVQTLLEAVERKAAAGVAVVLVEQSLNVATSICDHAFFMERGTIRFSGNPADLLDRGDLARAVFLKDGVQSDA